MSASAFAAVLQLLKSGQAREALLHCEKALLADPDNAGGHLLLASVLHRLGQADQSRSALDQAASLYKGNPAGLLQVAQAYQRTGHIDQALSVLDSLPETMQGSASLHGQLLWQAGRYDHALNRFRENVRTEPGLEENHHRLIRALIRFGHLDDARQVIEQALGRFPGSEELNRLRILALLDCGESMETLADQLQGFARPGTSAAIHHLTRALSVGAGRATLDEPGYPFASEHESAAWESFDWLVRQNPQVRLFGSGTGVLRWAVDQAPAEGIFVECGVFHGFSINRLAQWSGREMHGFDSFSGLPEDWKPGEAAGSYSTQGQLPAVPSHVQLHAGWFEASLPEFAARLEEPIALLHVDCDLYSSTREVLEHLGPRLHENAIVVFDDFLAYPGYRDHEFRAALEYFKTSGYHPAPSAGVILGRTVAFIYERDP